jgi:hypothetical protein
MLGSDAQSQSRTALSRKRALSLTHWPNRDYTQKRGKDELLLPREGIVSLAHHFIPLQLGIITGAAVFTHIELFSFSPGDSFETRQKKHTHYCTAVFTHIELFFFFSCNFSTSTVKCSAVKEEIRNEKTLKAQ